MNRYLTIPILRSITNHSIWTKTMGVCVFKTEWKGLQCVAHIFLLQIHFWFRLGYIYNFYCLDLIYCLPCRSLCDVVLCYTMFARSASTLVYFKGSIMHLASQVTTIIIKWLQVSCSSGGHMSTLWDVLPQLIKLGHVTLTRALWHCHMCIYRPHIFYTCHMWVYRLHFPYTCHMCV